MQYISLSTGRPLVLDVLFPTEILPWVTMTLSVFIFVDTIALFVYTLKVQVAHTAYLEGKRSVYGAQDPEKVYWERISQIFLGLVSLVAVMVLAGVISPRIYNPNDNPFQGPIVEVMK